MKKISDNSYYPSTKKYIDAKALYDRQRELEADAESNLLKAAEAGNEKEFEYWKTAKALRGFFCMDILAFILMEEKNKSVIDTVDFMDENKDWLDKEFEDSEYQVTLRDLINDYFTKREKL